MITWIAKSLIFYRLLNITTSRVAKAAKLLGEQMKVITQKLFRTLHSTMYMTISVLPSSPWLPSWMMIKTLTVLALIVLLFTITGIL